MSSRGKDFVGLVPTSEERPKPNFGGPWAGINIIRDSVDVYTLLLTGGLIQGVLLLLIGRLALLPTAAIISYRVLDAYAQATGFKRNTYLDDVPMRKTTVVFPNASGHYGNQPSNSDLVVFHLGVKFNHPLGPFSPGAKYVGDAFAHMLHDLETHADAFGFLGATSWQSILDASKNELLFVCYFRTIDGLQRFAHSGIHLKSWNWYNKEFKRIPHIALYHETYHVPAGHWEEISANRKISGLGSTVFKVVEEGTGREVYARPIVDASKGVLKTAAGRMKGSGEDEHAKLVEVDPWVEKE